MVRFWFSVDAGALGIVARDHAHTFLAMANIAARPGILAARVRRPGGALFILPAGRSLPRQGRDQCHKRIADHLGLRKQYKANFELIQPKD
jgi:hypothetical protein